MNKVKSALTWHGEYYNDDLSFTEKLDKVRGKEEKGRDDLASKMSTLVVEDDREFKSNIDELDNKTVRTSEEPLLE